MIRKYALLAGSLLMGISFFLPWVTLGDILSGYDLAGMYQRMYDNQLYLRYMSVPKVAVGILFFYILKAPRNLIYYAIPVLSLVPLTVLDAAVFEYETVHYGFYLLHVSVIIIWIGAFSYKYQTDPVLKSAAKE